MDSARFSSDSFEIWLKHLIDCARHAESCTIPFTDLFGAKAYAFCMKCETKTIRDRMNEAGIASVPVKGVTEAVYHARDIAQVFGGS